MTTTKENDKDEDSFLMSCVCNKYLVFILCPYLSAIVIVDLRDKVDK